MRFLAYLTFLLPPTLPHLMTLCQACETKTFGFRKYLSFFYSFLKKLVAVLQVNCSITECAMEGTCWPTIVLIFMGTIEGSRGKCCSTTTLPFKILLIALGS